MRWLILLIGLPVSIGLVITSMIANWWFGTRERSIALTEVLWLSLRHRP